MKRKSDLLQATERRLFWQSVEEMFEGWLAQLAWAYLERQNRKQAKALAKRGML